MQRNPQPRYGATRIGSADPAGPVHGEVANELACGNGFNERRVWQALYCESLTVVTHSGQSSVVQDLDSLR